MARSGFAIGRPAGRRSPCGGYVAPERSVNLDCFSAGGPVVPSPVTDEQAALRRVATLIARAAQPPAVFAAVAEEVGRLLPADRAFVVRYLRVERPAKGGTLVAADIPLPD